MGVGRDFVAAAWYNPRRPPIDKSVRWRLMMTVKEIRSRTVQEHAVRTANRVGPRVLHSGQLELSDTPPALPFFANWSC